MKNYFRIGKIINTFGIKGEVKVFPYTDDIRRFDDLTEFYLSTNDDASDTEFDGAQIYKKSSVKYSKGIALLGIIGIDTIEKAKIILHNNIYVNRKNAVKLNDGECYVQDLIGADAVLDEKIIGKVTSIMKTGANDVLEVNMNDKEILIPLVNDFIIKLEPQENKVILKTIEGLT